MGLTNRLHVGCEGKTGVKGDSRVSGPKNCKDGVYIE